MSVTTRRHYIMYTACLGANKVQHTTIGNKIFILEKEGVIILYKNDPNIIRYIKNIWYDDIYDTTKPLTN